jgi:hypothetical protein
MTTDEKVILGRLKALKENPKSFGLVALIIALAGGVYLGEGFTFEVSTCETAVEAPAEAEAPPEPEPEPEAPPEE